MSQNDIRYILNALGIHSVRHIKCFGRFYFALVAGGIVLWGIHTWLLPPDHWMVWLGWDVWLAVILWQPLVEELLFRGVIQGFYLEYEWGRKSWMKISLANLVTSIMFMAMHFINHPPLWAIGVIFPSLVFGYFRERCDSVFPPIALHVLYNFGYFIAVAY